MCAEALTIPVVRVVPCMDFTENAVHVVAAITNDEPTWFATYSLTPDSDQHAQLPVYSAQPGDVWTTEYEPGDFTAYEYLGRYKLADKFSDTDWGRGHLANFTMTPRNMPQPRPVSVGRGTRLRSSVDRANRFYRFGRRFEPCRRHEKSHDTPERDTRPRRDTSYA